MSAGKQGEAPSINEIAAAPALHAQPPLPGETQSRPQQFPAVGLPFGMDAYRVLTRALAVLAVTIKCHLAARRESKPSADATAVCGADGVVQEVDGETYQPVGCVELTCGGCRLHDGGRFFDGTLSRIATLMRAGILFIAMRIEFPSSVALAALQGAAGLPFPLPAQPWAKACKTTVEVARSAVESAFRATDSIRETIAPNSADLTVVRARLSRDASGAEVPRLYAYQFIALVGVPLGAGIATVTNGLPTALPIPSSGMIQSAIHKVFEQRFGTTESHLVMYSPSFAPQDLSAPLQEASIPAIVHAEVDMRSGPDYSAALLGQLVAFDDMRAKTSDKHQIRARWRGHLSNRTAKQILDEHFDLISERRLARAEKERATADRLSTEANTLATQIPNMLPSEAIQAKLDVAALRAEAHAATERTRAIIEETPKARSDAKIAEAAAWSARCAVGFDIGPEPAVFDDTYVIEGRSSTGPGKIVRGIRKGVRRFIPGHIFSRAVPPSTADGFPIDREATGGWFPKPPWWQKTTTAPTRLAPDPTWPSKPSAKAQQSANTSTSVTAAAQPASGPVGSTIPSPAPVAPAGVSDPYAHAVSLISLLHPAPHAQALIEMTSMPSKKIAYKRYFFYATLAAEYAMEETAKGHSVYVALNPRSQMSAFETDVPYVTTIGLDLQPDKNGFEGDSALDEMRTEMDRRFALGGILPTAWACSGSGLHAYFRLSEAAERSRAKTIWQRLCRFTGSDPVHNPNRIFRVPGSKNTKTKPFRPCFLLTFDPTRLHTIEQIDAALNKLGAGPATPTRPRIPFPEGPSEDLVDLMNRLPEGVRYAIQTGERNAYSPGQVTRSETDWYVVCSLVRAGCTDATIVRIFTDYPVGGKYREDGQHYLTKSILNARGAT